MADSTPSQQFTHENTLAGRCLRHGSERSARFLQQTFAVYRPDNTIKEDEDVSAISRS